MELLFWYICDCIIHSSRFVHTDHYWLIQSLSFGGGQLVPNFGEWRGMERSVTRAENAGNGRGSCKPKQCANKAGSLLNCVFIINPEWLRFYRTIRGNGPSHHLGVKCFPELNFQWLELIMLALTAQIQHLIQAPGSFSSRSLDENQWLLFSSDFMKFPWLWQHSLVSKLYRHLSGPLPGRIESDLHKWEQAQDLQLHAGTAGTTKLSMIQRTHLVLGLADIYLRAIRSLYVQHSKIASSVTRTE